MLNETLFKKKENEIKIIGSDTENVDFEFTVNIEKGFGGYMIGIVEELKGCYSQASSIEKLLEALRQEIETYIDIKFNKVSYFSESRELISI